MGAEQDLKFNVYSAISRAIINKHKFLTSQWLLFKWWLLKEPLCLWKLHTIEVFSYRCLLHCQSRIIVSYFRHFVVVDGVIFWSIKSVWVPTCFERPFQPSEALKSASLHTSIAFSHRINPLMAISVKDKREARFKLFDNTRNWPISQRSFPQLV